MAVANMQLTRISRLIAVNERLRCLGWLPKKQVQEPRCSKVVNPQPIVQHGVKVVKRVNSSLISGPG